MTQSKEVYFFLKVGITLWILFHYLLPIAQLTPSSKWQKDQDSGQSELNQCVWSILREYHGRIKFVKHTDLVSFGHSLDLLVSIFIHRQTIDVGETTTTTIIANQTRLKYRTSFLLIVDHFHTTISSVSNHWANVYQDIITSNIIAYIGLLCREFKQ